MIVRPTNPDVKVPDPAHRGEPPENYWLPLDGRDVGSDNPGYWFRVIRDGDAVEVVVADSPAAPPAEA